MFGKIETVTLKYREINNYKSFWLIPVMDISENGCGHIRNTSAEEMRHCIRAYLAGLRKLSLLECNPSETLASLCQSTWRQISAVQPQS